METKCFADRKDGTCHALKKKVCEGCKFYMPRNRVRNNPFYKWSYIDVKKFNWDRKMRKIEMKDVMRKND